ncbi:hypothetical protein QTP70_021357 [Hemibagrus guttatus]|uniref:heme oxygenase (biliverdin-producing) n=1 Tax=Hemibagrus guttatus TaxID=175788 RepID=A0AAE0QHF3_9TELE|nr:hypothetical protein QTP70_021357 [Hemibagrus guttatus]
MIISRSSAGSVIGEVFCNGVPPEVEVARSIHRAGDRGRAEDVVGDRQKDGNGEQTTKQSLFYLAQQNFIQAEMAFKEATKQQRAALVCSSPEQRTETVCGSHTHSEDSEPVDKPAVEGLTEGETEEQGKPQSSQNIRAEEGDKTRADPVQTFHQDHQSPTRVGTTIYMETVKFLLQSYTLQMAQRALAQELLCPDGGPSSSYFLALAQIQLLRGEYSSAEASLQQALSHNFQNPDVWALYGHMHYMIKDYNQAQDSYERTLDFVTDASDTHPVYLRLGSIYIQKGQYDKAKPTYMLACKSSPSCLTWLGLGIACYRLEELTEAEDALTEANALNNRNPEVWGYLSLICLQTGRKLEAEQSFKYAVKDLEGCDKWNHEFCSFPYRPEDLSELLAAGTKQVHEQAEDTQFVKDFLHGRIRKELFKLGAVALYYTYSAMEEEIEKNKDHPHFAPLYFPNELHRHEALAQDLEYFYGEDWQSQISCSPATQRYVERLREIGREDPVLLVAHAYTRYMGDLSGGQVLKKVAQRALKLPPTGEGVFFYQFDCIHNNKAFKQLYRSRMNELELDTSTKDSLVQEAVRAFQCNIEVFQELEEMGKTIQEDVLDGGPIHGHMQGDISKCPYYAAKMAASGGSAYVYQMAAALLRNPTGQVLVAAWIAALAGLVAWYLI